MCEERVFAEELLLEVGHSSIGLLETSGIDEVYDTLGEIRLGEISTRAFPLLDSVVDIDNLIPDSVDRIHVMRIDDGGDIILLGDLVNELVDHRRGLGVEPRVWLIAEEVLRI